MRGERKKKKKIMEIKDKVPGAEEKNPVKATSLSKTREPRKAHLLNVLAQRKFHIYTREKGKVLHEREKVLYWTGGSTKRGLHSTGGRESPMHALQRSPEETLQGKVSPHATHSLTSHESRRTMEAFRGTNSRLVKVCKDGISGRLVWVETEPRNFAWNF